MIASFLSLSSSLFSIIILLVSIGISAHIAFGHGTKKARDLIYKLYLLLIVGCQLYYLILASTYIPSNRFHVYDTSLRRDQCIQSGKGGKRPGNAIEDEYLNPCFCNDLAKCIDSVTGAVYASSSCPKDGSAICLQLVDNSSIPLYVSNERNCAGGQNRKCSKLEPCYPCERERLEEFGGGRCVSCTNKFQGNCNFIQNIGPYCFKSNSSREIEPCKQCCTDPTPLLLLNQKCV